MSKSTQRAAPQAADPQPAARSMDQTIAEYHPRLKTFIKARVAGNQDAEDILQDVFYQYSRIDEVVEQAGAWLFRVARNMIINMRKKKREESMPVWHSEEEDEDILQEFSDVFFGNTADSTPEDEYLHSLVWEELEEALAELPPEQCEAFELTQMQGFSLKEVSEKTGVPVNTILSRKHYAVTHLRKRLKGLYEDILTT